MDILKITIWTQFTNNEHGREKKDLCRELHLAFLWNCTYKSPKTILGPDNTSQLVLRNGKYHIQEKMKRLIKGLALGISWIKISRKYYNFQAQIFQIW